MRIPPLQCTPFIPDSLWLILIFRFSFSAFRSHLCTCTIRSPSLTAPFDDVPFTLCITLPLSYPSSSKPPQLQLLSRYIGDFGVDASLFGSITRTFFSTDIAWQEGEVVVFNGIENARASIASWYGERLSEKEAGRLARGDDVKEELEQAIEDSSVAEPTPILTFEVTNNSSTGSLEGIEILEGPPIQDRGSSFIARVCRITDPTQVR